MYNEQDATQWLKENSIWCEPRKAKVSPKQCKHQSAREARYKFSLCKECARFVSPTKKDIERVTVRFGTVPIGKRKNVQRTSSK